MLFVLLLDAVVCLGAHNAVNVLLCVWCPPVSKVKITLHQINALLKCFSNTKEVLIDEHRVTEKLQKKLASAPWPGTVKSLFPRSIMIFDAQLLSQHGQVLWIKLACQQSHLHVKWADKKDHVTRLKAPGRDIKWTSIWCPFVKNKGSNILTLYWFW